MVDIALNRNLGLFLSKSFLPCNQYDHFEFPNPAVYFFLVRFMSTNV